MKIKLSKAQWETIGKTAGWLKKANDSASLFAEQVAQLAQGDDVLRMTFAQGNEFIFHYQFNGKNIPLYCEISVGEQDGTTVFSGNVKSENNPNFNAKFGIRSGSPQTAPHEFINALKGALMDTFSHI